MNRTTPQGGPTARRTPIAARLLRAYPALLTAFAVLIFYAIESTSRSTPWIFGDELEWSQISRSIAETGESARRGDPIYFKSIYAWLIAPFWRAESTTAAYAGVKYANAVIMPLAAIPTFLLARMVVSRRSAVFVAVASVSIPGMAYATSIVPEVAFYPTFALCSWLAVRALTSGKRLDIALAVAAALGSYFVRQREFAPIVVALAIAGAGLWVTGPRGRAVRRTWTRGDTIGALVLGVGALFLFNRVVLQHIHEWQFTTEYYKWRMLDLGVQATFALTVGLGLFPVIGGLASLRLRERAGQPAYRAFAAWTGACIVTVGLYTAVKSAYLSTNFASLAVERNMIYLAPLLLVGTALVIEARSIDWRIVAGAGAFVAFMVWRTPLQLGFPYYEAPGFSIPAMLNTYRHWGPNEIRFLLAGVLVLGLAVVLARRMRVVRIIGALAAIAWMLTGEVGMTVGMNRFSDQYRSNLPARLDWVDAATHGGKVTYLGQSIQSPFGVWLTEFWNRSILHVDSLDGTAPGPGPTAIPSVISPDGLLSDWENTPYVLADAGIEIDGDPVAREGQMTLYRVHGPWRLVFGAEGIFADGWCGKICAFTYYKPGQHGTLKVTLSREAYNGSAPPGKTTLLVGTVRIGADARPYIDRRLRRIDVVVANGTQQTIDIPISQTPIRLVVRTRNPIQPTANDSRFLSAQTGFVFVPETTK